MLAAVWDNFAGFPTRTFRLNFDGGDILKDPTGAVNAFGVALDSIQIDEVGPGGVSSLSGTINDPAVVATLAERQTVDMWDVTNNRPLFLGFLDTFSVRTTATGREIDFTCVGIEAVLDWMIVPSLTIPTGTLMHDALQTIVANATGVGVRLRALVIDDPIHTIPVSSVASPIMWSATATTLYDVVLDGSTVRDACAKVITAGGNLDGLVQIGTIGTSAVVTVDFYYGLRLWYTDQDGLPGAWLSGYGNVAIDDSIAGTYAANSLSLTVNSGIPRAVYVTGGNALGSGLVSDGSGLPGMVAQLNDSTSLTTTQRDIIGANYLKQYQSTITAPLILDPVPAAIEGNDIRPGGTVSFAVDTQVFGEGTTAVIAQLTTTFPQGNQRAWNISFGGFRTSAIREIRRLTRGVRN